MNTPRLYNLRASVIVMTALVCVLALPAPGFFADASGSGRVFHSAAQAAEFDVDSGRVILRQLQFCVDCGSALLVSGVRPGVLVRCPDCGKEQTRLANPYVLSQVYQICNICQAPLNPEGHRAGDTVECANCHTSQVLDRDAFASAKKSGDKNLGLGYMPGFPPGKGKKKLLLSPNKSDARLSMIPLPEGSGELPLPPELAFRKIPAPPEGLAKEREAFEDLALLPSPGETPRSEGPRSVPAGKSPAQPQTAKQTQTPVEPYPAAEPPTSPRTEAPPLPQKQSPAPQTAQPAETRLPQPAAAAAPPAAPRTPAQTAPEAVRKQTPAGPVQPLPPLSPVLAGSGGETLGIGPIGRGDVAVVPEPMLPVTETVIRKTPAGGSSGGRSGGSSAPITQSAGNARPSVAASQPTAAIQPAATNPPAASPAGSGRNGGASVPSLAKVPEWVPERQPERPQPKRLTEVMEVPAVTADLFGGPREGNGANDDRYRSSGKGVARVDGEPIYARDVARVVDPVMRRLRSQAGVSEQELGQREGELKREVLERLIDREVAMREAAAIGFRPDPTAVREREAELAQILAGSGVDIRTEARRDVTMQEMRRRFAEKPATASPAEIREFYKQHKGQMLQPRMIALDQIIVYEDRTYRRDKRSSREIAFEIANELEAGSRFDDLRARYDEFWEAAGLDYAAPTLQVGGGMSRQILSSLGDMRKGAVFGPVFMSGMALFGKIVDERPEGPAPFEEVKEEIRKKLEADAAERNLDNWLKRLRQKARIEVLTGVL